MAQPSTPSSLLQSVTPPELAPWGRRCRRSSVPPLMGFAFAPLPTSLCSRPLPPDPKIKLRRPTSTPTACSALMVSHHHDGFLRERAVSLLRLTAGLRFAAFPSSPSTSTAEAADPERFSTSPQRVSHPSKDSPRQQPYRVTAAVAFLTFHSLRAPHQTPKCPLCSHHCASLRRVECPARHDRGRFVPSQPMTFLSFRPKPNLQVSFSSPPKRRHNRSASRPWFE
jgi:hypothetical protein